MKRALHRCPHPGEWKRRWHGFSRVGTVVDIKLMPVLQFAPFRGAIAQLGERLHGMQEVDGSIPSGSTRSEAASDARSRPDASSPHRLEA